MHVAPDLTSCDREPIHTPGAIQPHGLLLVASADDLTVTGGAGDIEARLARDWFGQPLSRLLGQDVAAQLAAMPAGVKSVALAGQVRGAQGAFDALAHRDGPLILVELEPAPATRQTAMALLWELDQIARGFESAASIADLCQRAVAATRDITGFDRVMAYRFLDDGAGEVIAEAHAPGWGGFLGHRFPAGDIPRQARALYVRNRARLIADVGYVPAPLRPDRWSGLDLSDVGLRSVSPAHLQYLRNMGVGASASFSVVRDGALWGLVACHHAGPRHPPREIMAAATAVANALGRQLAARESEAAYARRLRLRGVVDDLLGHFHDDRPLAAVMEGLGESLRAAFDADGFVFVDGGRVRLWGVGPRGAALQALAAWTLRQTRREPLAMRSLGDHYPPARAWPQLASGLMAAPLAREGRALIWLRVEQVEEVRWAGDPASFHAASPDLPLTPRRSFATWAESVGGLSRPWTAEAADAARRLARGIDDARFHRRLRLLNRELHETVEERNALLAQQELMMREVDHRVQNSLQMVNAYLRFQAREAGQGAVADILAEAQARIAAVGLLHRRLYRADRSQAIELGAYLTELLDDLRAALGPEWAGMLRARIADMLVDAGRAVQVGVVMTELVINASKYAYGGAPGPVEVTLERVGDRFRLTVADHGEGGAGGGAPQGGGFGGRLIAGTAQRLRGVLERTDNGPGVRATLTAAIND
ncbi:histidine kinase dimerization/phosphoacceptor domain -containing protein [Camelimonas abortus]|uniref:Histidine kinase dimerization/phosphoacceptor domain -containing protein n=1 Tax=Camelimonas abortus TaxID=1017184 RepID=A0ABV7LFE5_9HYPH